MNQKFSFSGIRSGTRKTKLEGRPDFSDMLMELEQRIAFDAAAVEHVEAAVERQTDAELAGEGHETAALVNALTARDAASATTDSVASGADTSVQNRPGPDGDQGDHGAVDTGLTVTEALGETGSRTEIVFISATVEDIDTLLASIGDGIEVVVLDPSGDGVEQMAAVLQGRTDIDAIHIIAHGGEGQLELGSAVLNAQTMQGEYLDELAIIGNALTADGDILIYGCDFTAGDAGLQAAIVLGGITGADIAASEDTTGHANLGGDWDLETNIGTIETETIDASDWEHALVNTIINPTGGSSSTGADGLRIYVTNLGQIQVLYKGLTQFYSPSQTDTSSSIYNGMYMAVGNRIVGSVNGAGAGIVDSYWVSHSAQTLTGAGTEANPYVVTTRMYYDANGNGSYNAATDVLMTVETIYAYPNAYFTENITITPPANNTQVIKYYHAMDTYLAGGDQGPAFSLDPSLAINNITDGDPSYVGVRKGIGTASEAIVGFAEIDGGRQFDRYYSAAYAGMYASMNDGGDMTNTWNTSPTTDNGIAVQFTLGVINTPQTLSYHIAFDGDTSLDLDANNSTASGTSYAGTFQATTGGQVRVVDTDIDIVNVIGGIADATVTLNNPFSGDVLTVVESDLPAGITVTVHSAYSVTIAGVATASQYEIALQAIRFSTTSGVTTPRTFTIGVHNQLNSVETTATATLTGDFSPTVDLNSGLAAVVGTNNIIVNGDFGDYADRPYGWTEGGSGVATDSAITGRYAFTANAAATLTQSGLNGLNSGPGLNGAGRIELDLGWVNTASQARTFDIMIGSTVYARLTTGTTGTGGTVTYLAGATNAAGTTSATSLTAMGSATGDLTSLVINLPTTVAATGSLVFNASNSGDDVFIDNVRVLTSITSMVDETAGSDWNATYIENGTPVSIADIDNDVRDGDSPNMASGVITITNAQAGDRLLVGGSAAASGTINGIAYTNTGTTVTFAGLATRANYAAAIRAITFENTGNAPGSVVRDITVRVNDGVLNSNIAHAYITVIPVNDAPAGADRTVTMDEDTSYTFAVSDFGFSDPADNNAHTFLELVVTTLPVGGGTLLLGGVPVTAGQVIPVAQIGQLTYTPPANANGSAYASFTFQVRDNGGTANGGVNTDPTPNTITFNVSAVNDAPVNTLPAQSGNEDANIALAGLSVADLDAGSGAVQVTLSVPSGQGTLTATASGGVTVSGTGSNVLVLTGTVANINTFLAGTATRPVFRQSVADFNGSVSLTMTTSDLGNTGTGGALTDTDTVQITIVPVADIAGDTATTNEDTSVAILPFANDTFENAGRAITAINGLAIVAGGTPVAVANGTVALNAAGTTLTFAPAANYNGATSFTYTVTSGGVTETATVNVTVNAVNDAPVNTAPASYSMAEDSGTLQLTGLSISDADAGSASMSVTLSVAAGSGTFTATSGGGVTVTGSSTGTLTLTGTQAAINTFLAGASAPRFVQVADFNGTVNITMLTSDNGNTGAGGTQTATTVIPVTISPVVDIVADSVTTAEDVPVTFNVITGTNGASADSFENSGRYVSAINGAAFTPGTPVSITGGTITVATDGTVTFTPAANYNGITSFTYTVTSGGVTETATVTLTVTAVNDAPTIVVPGAQTTTEDAVLAIGGITVADVDSASISTTVSIPAGAGALSVTGMIGVTVTGNGTATVQLTGTPANINSVLASLIYTPTADYNNGPSGSFTLSVSANDGTATTTGAVLVRVTPVADIVNDTVSTVEDTPVTFNVLSGANTAGGADSFEGTATVTAINGAAFVAGSPIVVTGGTISVQPDGTVVFTPTGNFSGTTTFSYSVSAGGSGTPVETAVVTITTSPVNDAPVNTMPLSYSVAEDAPLSLSGLSVADVDAGSSPITVTLAIPAGAGTLSAASAGGVTVTGSGTNSITLTGTLASINSYLASAAVPQFIQVPDFNGSITLTMTTNDGGATGAGGALTDQDSVVIQIAPVVDIQDDAVSTDEDTPVAITPLANDSFENSGRQITSINSSAIVAGGPAITVANGTVSLSADGVTLTFTPTANYNGATSFTYTVTSGGVTETATINVTVNSVNDTPVNTYPASYTTAEDTPLHLTGLSIADSDAGSSAVTVTLSVPSGSGTLSATSGAGVTIGGSGSNSLSLTGTVSAINAYLASAASPLFTQSPADFNGTVTLTMFTTDNGATGGPAETDTDTIPITITPVADAVSDSVSTLEDTNLAFNVLTGAGGASADSFEGTPAVTQINGAAFTPGVAIAITGGAITVQADGSVLFAPNLNYNGSTGFTYTVTSGGVTETASVSITVIAQNDAPVVVAPLADRTGNDGDPVTLPVAGSFSDVDDATLTYSATGLPTGLTIDPVTGVISGTISSSASLSDPFHVTVTATDAGGLTVSTSFEWTINNPAPVAGDDVNTVTEDIVLTVTAASGLLSNDIDPDNDVLSVTGFTIAGNPTAFTAGQTATIPGVGLLTINADGSYSFAPSLDYNGPVPVVTYTVSDGQGGTDTATLTLSVTAVDDPQTVGGLGDGPVAGTDAQVRESDLANGTNPSGTAEAASGTFTITNSDGVTSLSVGGTVISFAALQATATTPVSVTTAHGTLVINGYDAATGTVSYTFTLTSAVDHAATDGIERVTIVLTAGNGAIASGTLGILVIDDAPIANDDADATINVPGNPSSEAGGNVISGLDNPSAPDLDPADGTPDVEGADGGLTVTSVGFGTPSAANVGVSIAGAWGTFILDASGNYNYVPDYSNPVIAGLTPPDVRTDTFTYVVTDSDGSTATATITITITGTPTILGLGDGPETGTDGNVLESDLPGGTNASGPGEVLNGQFRAIAGQHALDALWVGGTEILAADLANSATTPISITTTYGTIVINGFDAVSERVTYTYTLTAPVVHPATGLVTDDIEVRIVDGIGNSSTHTLAINIVDDAPSATDDAASITEDAVPNTVGGSVLTNDQVGADADATPVTGVGVGTPSSAPGSVVTGTYGSLLLNADGTYVYTLDNSRSATNALRAGQIVTEIFTYEITDADGDTALADIVVTITGANDAPSVVIAVPDQANVDSQAVSLDVSGNFADVDSAVLTYALGVGSVLPAGLSLNTATGVISGTLSNAASQGGTGGVYSITIIASDADGGSVQDTFIWTVTNPVPVAVDDLLTVGENATGSGNVLGNDTDPDGDVLSVVGVGQGASPTTDVGVAVAGSNGGTFTVSAAGLYTFAPGTAFDDLAPGQSRVTTVNYRISDGNGGFAVATIIVTVNGANDAPQAVADVVTTGEDTPLVGNVLTNDTDVDNPAADLEVRSFAVDGDVATYAAGSTATIAGVGTITINADGSYLFEPLANYAGAVPVITYTMADGPVSQPLSLTSTATLTISVIEINDVPVAGDDVMPVVEDTPVSGNVLANDSDADGDLLTVTGFQIGAVSYLPGDSADIPGVGTLVINASGAYTFTPAPNYNGPVPSVTYFVSDGRGGVADATLLLGPVSSVDDAPVAADDAFVTDQNTAIVNGDLYADNGAGIDYDDDAGDTLTVISVNGAALVSGSTITLASGALLTVNADGTFSFDPNGVYDSLPEGQTATESFSYTISDSAGLTATADVTITINGLDDELSITGLDDGTGATDGSVDESDLPAGSTPAGTGEVLTGTLTLTAIDGIAALSVNGTPVFVMPTPGAPLVVAGTNGTLRVTNYDAATGLVTYVYTLTSAADQSGGDVTDDFLIELWDLDGDYVNGTLSILINDDQPVANDDVGNASEDALAPVTGNVLANDVLGADRTGGAVTAVSGGTVGTAFDATYGTLTLNADGSYSYTVDTANPLVQALQQGATLSDIFTYQYTDGDGDMVSADLEIVIHGENDVPVAVDDPITVTEDTPATGNVLANDTDADGDTLTVTSFNFGGVDYAAGQTVTIPGVGSLVINADGSFVFTPAPNYEGVVPDAVYTVSDGHGGSDTGTLIIGQIVAVNDAPVNTVPAPLTIAEDAGPVAIAGVSVADPDSTQVLTTTLSIPPAAGALFATGGVYDPVAGVLTITGTASQINAALATLAYTPVADFNTGGGDFTVTMVTDDGVAPAVTSTFAITVTPVADIVADTVATDEDVAVTFDPLDGAGGAQADNFENAGAAITSITQPGIGSAVLNGDGTITYTPPANFNGSTTMTYTVTSGGVTETATITINVAPVNDAPVAADDAFTTDQNTPILGNLFDDNGSGVDTDVDDPLNISAVNGVALVPGAVITLASGAHLVVHEDGTFSYDPNGAFDSLPEGWADTDSFDYTITDPSGASSIATVTITVNGLDDTLSLAGVDDVAAGVDGAVDESDLADGTTPTGTDVIHSGSFTALAVDGVQSLTIGGTAIVAPTPGVPTIIAGTYGTLYVTGFDQATGTVTYEYHLTTPADQSGGDVTDDFAIVLTDRDGDVAGDTLGIRINDDSPIANDDANNIDDDAVAPVTGNVLANDVLGADRTGAGLTGISTSSASAAIGAPLAGAYGSVTLLADGSYAYTVDTTNPDVMALAQGQQLLDIFTYSYVDGDGDTVSAQLVITIEGHNDAPVAVDDIIPVTEDVVASGNVLGNDSDANGDALAVSGFSFGGNAYAPGQTATIAGVGSLRVNADGTFTFTPALNFNGAVPSATYSISDGFGGTASALMIIGPVAAVNDAPVAVDDTASGRGGDAITIPVLANDSDVEGDTLSVVAIDGVAVTIGVPISVTGGTVVLNADGTLTYTPNIGHSGAVVFTYTISDGNGGFATATISVDVQAGYLEVDPPFVAPEQSGGAPAWISASGFVGQSIGDLNGTSLSAEGMIDGVANAIRSLNGISGLSAQGSVGQAVHQIGNWLGAEERLADAAANAFDGGSLLRVAGGDDATWFIVDSIMRDGVLHMSILTSEGRGEARSGAGHTVTLADGRALPGWVELARGGMLIGRPPAGLPFLDLRIQAQDKDGRVVEDIVRIDLATGTIADHSAQQRTQADPLLFSAQTALGIAPGMNEAGSLAAALSGWSGMADLPDQTEHSLRPV